MSNVGTWSVDATENNKPAPNGWPENMAPSEVNNSARENMAAIKRMTLDLPYISVGGVVTYVDSKTVSIADDSLDTNYAQYYTTGRRVKVKQTTGDYYGTVTGSTYASGVSTISLAMDDGALPTQGTLNDVLVGLSFVDMEAAVGPNMLGMVLPYTAEVDEIPFGFGLADGTVFDPNIYKDLASLYFTGYDDNGLPTYKYGREAVSGVYWPKKPDVRGYFPRFLDLGAGRDSTSDREVGSTQEDAMQPITGTFGNISNMHGVTATGAFEAIAGSLTGDQHMQLYNTYSYKFDSSKVARTASETRAKNIAFPGLLVMHGGYATAGQLKPEALVNAMMANMDIYIVRVTEHLPNSRATLDKTYNEIATAYDAGKMVSLYDDETRTFMPYVQKQENGGNWRFVFRSSLFIQSRTGNTLNTFQYTISLVGDPLDNRTGVFGSSGAILPETDYVYSKSEVDEMVAGLQAQIGELNRGLDAINGETV